MKRIAAGILSAAYCSSFAGRPANAQAPRVRKLALRLSKLLRRRHRHDASTATPSKTGGVSIAVEVPIVTIEAGAATNNGDLITGLKRDNFRIYEDGVPQQITNFRARAMHHHHGARSGVPSGRSYGLLWLSRKNIGRNTCSQI